jgi:hypothetical protein
MPSFLTNRFGLRKAAILGLLLVLTSAAKAQNLFDGGLGTLPQAQGWAYAVLGVASANLVDGAAVLDTSASGSTHAGWSQVISTGLNRTNGFGLLFTVRIAAETHSSANRAGFSVIVLGEDARGVELGFWNDRIFVQTDIPLFTHGEDVAFPTTNNFVAYALRLFATNYLLEADSKTILTGRIRDYTAYSGLFNVYSTPNFLFLGDDTGSAGGRAEVRSVTLVPAPRLAITPQGIITWTGISNQLYQVEVSSDLASWSNAAAVSSASGAFAYTNRNGPSPQFYRIMSP